MRRYQCMMCIAFACIILGGCAATVAQPPAGTSESAAEPLETAVPIVQAQKGIAFSNQAMEEEQDAAVAELLRRGVLTEEDISGKALGSIVTRARFIELIVKTLALPVSDSGDSGLKATAYAPYVQAGYSAGLFANSEQEMSFTPTDGFFMAERGYSDMEEPMSRYDMAAIFANVLTGTGRERTFRDQPWLLEKDAAVRENVFLSVEEGILDAYEDGAFHGDSGMTLGQTAGLLCRLLRCDITIRGMSQTPSATPIETLRQTKRVIHAGGRYLCGDGKSRSYTNSAEALVHAYRAGQRVVELDITMTTDGHLACIHDWLHEFAPNITDGEPLSLAEWMDSRIKGSLTPLCAESLAGFMREHPDLYVITDVKDDNVAAIQELARACPDIKDRFIIQIYKESEYDPVRSCGFTNIIYTLYDLPQSVKMDYERLTAFSASHPLVGYTYPLSYFQMEGYHEGIADTGVPLFVHTVNGLEAQEACYAAGVTAVYTDDVE